MIVELESCCILVVDDDRDSRDLLAIALEMEGATVIAVDSAIAAFKVLEQFHPDLLICDLVMPEMDGFTLLTQLRSLPQWHQLRAIALTAAQGCDYEKQAIEAGFQMYFEKPIDLDQLISAARSLLTQKPNQRFVQSLCPLLSPAASLEMMNYPIPSQDTLFCMLH